MYVIGSFEQSTLLELALTELEARGVERERIFAVPLDVPAEPPRLFDTMTRSDGVSLFDTASVIGTVCAVFGASFGFILRWGPIIWGLLGMTGGFLIGLALDFAATKRKRRRAATRPTEIVVIVRCGHEQHQWVMQVLREHAALGIGLVGT